MSLIDEMQEYYARRAPEYDTSMGYDDPNRVASLAGAIGSVTRQLAGRQVLEIACGPGFWTQRVAGVAGVAADILATDFNDTTLAEARGKSFDGNVRFARADAYTLDDIPGGFDGAFAVDWFAHVPRSRIPAFLTTLHAHLVPGARVVLCDQTPGAASWESTFDTEGNHVQERTLHGTRYRVIKNFFDETELAAMFAPYAAREGWSIERFPECRRMVVGYTLRG